jgi:sucrose-6-phosphate hydrolase SacC (GH32 family)
MPALLSLRLMVAALAGETVRRRVAGSSGCHYTSQCISGSTCGPGGPCEDTSVGTVCPRQECGPPMGPSAPRFHIRGTSCGLNDPNGPFYDDTHGLYHLFWQSHETMVHNASTNNGTVCNGPVWAHAVSRNLSHWSRLPVALWNDKWFDLVAVYSGSVTIVNSTPVIIYPGICDKTHPECPQHWGVALAAAVPSNTSDPFYEEWVKRPPSGTPNDNPLVIGNEPLKDPSSAWNTSHGTWRLTTAGGDLYSSSDFRSWAKLDPPAGSKALFHGGECPSFFKLPKLVPGGSATVTPMPTHVFKWSADGSRDFVQVGTYDEGAANSTGTWTPLGSPRVVDNGAFYAAKDFEAPGGRRILFGWARVPGIQSLAREVTYDPALQQLCYNPVPELAALHAQPPLLNLTAGFTLTSGTDHSLGSWNDSLGNSSEVRVWFTLPRAEVVAATGNVTFGVGIMTSDKPPHAPSHVAFVEYQAPAAGATAYNITVGVHQHAGYRSKLSQDTRYSTSGSSRGGGNGGGSLDTLQLTATDKELDIRVFFDGHFAEVFFMSGRVAMTVAIPATKSSGFTVVADSAAGTGSPVSVARAYAYHMNSIWISKGDVWAGNNGTS